MRRPRGRWTAIALLAALGLGVRSRAEPDAGSLPHGHRYVELVASAGEPKALDAILAGDDDPWILAEELFLLHRTDLALSLCTARLTGDSEMLEAYLRRPPDVSRDLAARVTQAAAALPGDPETALSLLPGPVTSTLTVTEVRALLLRATALRALHRDPEADAAFEQASLRAQALAWQRAEKQARLALLDRLGLDDPREEGVLQRLLALDRDSRDLTRSATLCARLGQLAAEDEGNFRLARKWLLEAEALLDARASTGLTPEQTAQRADVLSTLSLVHLRLGNLASALRSALAAVDLAKDKAPRIRIQAARSLADAYQNMGRLDLAETFQQEAVDVAEAEWPERHPRILGDLARIVLERGDAERAHALYERVLASKRVMEDPRRRAVMRIHMAGEFIDAPEALRSPAGLQRALLELGELVADLERTPPEDWEPEYLSNAAAYQGRALNLLGRNEEAASHLQVAIEAPYLQQDPRLLAYMQLELARALRRRGDAVGALAYAEKALSALRERVERLPAASILSVLSQREVGDLVAEYVGSAIDRGSGTLVRRALETTRGMAYLPEVRRRRRAGSRSEGATTGLTELGADVARAARDYWQAYSTGARADAVRASRELWDRRMGLRNAQAREDLEAAAGGEPARTAALPALHAAPALRPDEAMLYYASAGDRSVAVLDWRDRTSTHVLGDSRALRKSIETLLATMSATDASVSAKALADVADLVVPAGLRGLLGVPAAATQPAPSHVYVSASHPFGGLPWPAVLDVALRAGGAPSAALPTVSLVASQRVLADVRAWNPPSTGGPMIALGDPDYTTETPERTRMVFFQDELRRLVESAAEVRAITSEERGDVRLLDDQATEANLRACLFETEYPFDVLHLSCHGKMYPSSAWLSSLAVHPSESDDGLLTADEVSGWRFQGGPRLVVLSACESGLGAAVPGEGEEGLVRAFLLAGARHVVASLWEVPDDVSRDLMIAFHKHRREESVSPVVALRRAQADVVRALGPKANVRDWAGWAVWGPRD